MGRGRGRSRGRSRHPPGETHDHGALHGPGWAHRQGAVLEKGGGLGPKSELRRTTTFRCWGADVIHHSPPPPPRAFVRHSDLLYPSLNIPKRFKRLKRRSVDLTWFRSFLGLLNCRAVLERGGGLGPKSVCTTNGPTRFSLFAISFFRTMVTLDLGGVGGSSDGVRPF